MKASGSLHDALAARRLARLAGLSTIAATMRHPFRLPLPRLVAFLACAAALSGCTALSVAGAAAGAAISVTGAVVSTGVKVTGKVVEKTIDAVAPGSESD